MPKDKEIGDIIRSERQRGRRQQIDFERAKQRRELKTRLVRAIEEGDEQGVLESIQALGYGKDSEEYRRAISLLRGRGLL